jgi:hypothetical protein
LGDFSPDDFGVKRVNYSFVEAVGGFYHRVEIAFGSGWLPVKQVSI